MKKLNNIFKMISQMEKNANEVNLGTHEIELGLIDDIEKLLDSTNNKRKQIAAQGLKISQQLLDLTVEYNKVVAMSIKAANSAKELGIVDAEKMFRVRGAEAQDYSETVGKVSNVITNSINSI